MKKSIPFHLKKYFFMKKESFFAIQTAILSLQKNRHNENEQ